MLIYEYPGDGVEAITRLKPQCANMTFYHKSIYNGQFQKVVYKGWDSANNCIKIFHNSKASEFSVENSYYEDQLMHTFLENFQKGRKYSDQISSHQAELIREENLLIKILIFICLAS